MYLFFILAVVAMRFRFLDLPNAVGGIEGDLDGS
jgi:hypothetical protein